MQRVLIIGAGGHGQVVADILLRARDVGKLIEPIGFVDDAPNIRGQQRLGLPIFGSLAELASLPHEALVMGVGSNLVRAHLFDDLMARGERFAIAIHPSAVIASDVDIGPGTVVCAGVVIGPGAVVGMNVILNTASSVDHHNHVNDHAHVAPGAHLGGDVWIGKGVLIGIGATVMPQRRVGAWSIVGAGALVNRDVPSKVTVVGMPARYLSR